MRKKDADLEFIEKCRNVDFSTKSYNKDKNLERLKIKLNELDFEGDIAMNKRFRKPALVLVVFGIMLILSAAVYAQGFLGRRRVASIGEHVHFYDVSGEDIDGVSLIATVTGSNSSVRHFDDKEAARNHFVSADIVLPSYIPKSFEISVIDYWLLVGGWGEDGRPVHEVELIRDFRRMGWDLPPLIWIDERSINMEMLLIVYTDGSDTISLRVQTLTEYISWSYVANDLNAEKTTVNGNDAIIIIDESVNIVIVEIDDVIYTFESAYVTVEDLVRMAESLR